MLTYSVGLNLHQLAYLSSMVHHELSLMIERHSTPEQVAARARLAKLGQDDHVISNIARLQELVDVLDTARFEAQNDHDLAWDEGHVKLSAKGV